MKHISAWKYLIGLFAVFWILFAVVLFLADIPFLIVSTALTTLFVISGLIVVLAWAYQNNY